MSRITIVIAAALAFTATLPIVPAHAQRDRTFGASYGTDNGNTLCSFGSPCKTFQNAINNTAVGGEVTAIDSAGFGTIIVSHAITITSPNGVEAGIAAPLSGAAAITINAETGDIIHLNGLTLDGDGVANTNGIAFNSGSTLRVQNCVIRNFSSDGIQFSPDASTQLFVSNTLVSDNGNDGIAIVANGSGTTTGVLDHVTMENNHSDGLYVVTAAQTVNVTVTDSVSANNVSDGIFAILSGGTINIMARNSTIANNSGDGLLAQGTGATISVTRSTITGNGPAWAEVSSGVVLSYGDNNIDGNGGNNSTPGSAIPYH